jgi:superfamily II DNA helicase RecQ
VIESGIVLIFIPLHTLSADVMHKFEEYNPTWGKVGVCHRQLYHSLLSGCTLLGRDTSSTFFIFLSPQFLNNHRDTLNKFVSCAHKRTLHVIAMDEAHIHVQHGTSFREDIRALQIEFFRKVYGNQPRDLRPWLIALTAAFPTTYFAL